MEPDTNMAGGEALIRQLLYGKAYYKEMFDVDSKMLWLPDTFGYSAALPQILRKCGVELPGHAEDRYRLHKRSRKQFPTTIFFRMNGP